MKIFESGGNLSDPLCQCSCVDTAQPPLLCLRMIRAQELTDSEHTWPIAGNVLNRGFTATEPDRGWVGDITYIWTTEGWLYLTVIIDWFSRRVVGCRW